MRIRSTVSWIAPGAAAMAYMSRYISDPKMLGSTWGGPIIYWGAMLSAAQSLFVRRNHHAYSSATHKNIQSQAATTRVCFANVLFSNPNPRGLAKEISRQDPDVVVLAETDNCEWGQILMAEFPRHHYRYTFEATTPGAGFKILSRLPITKVAAHKVGPDGRAFIAWRGMTTNGKWISFFTVHPPAPVTRQGRRDWALYFNRLQHALPSKGSLVIIGDFNATRNHGPFRKLHKHTGGDVVTENVPTWPQNRYPDFTFGNIIGRTLSTTTRLLPLDQAIVRGVTVAKVEFGDGTGSDHRPIYIDLLD